MTRHTTTPRTLPSLLALTLAMAIGFTMMASFGTVQEGAKAELGLSDAVLGVIQGVSAALALVVFSIPVGLLVDRFKRTRLLVALALVWTLGTAMTAVATGPVMLFVARVLAATGTTGALTAALSLTADLCPPERRGRAMLLVNLGKMAGLGAAFGIGGWLYGQIAAGGMPVVGGMAPWRGTHAVLAAIGAVAILPLFLLREPARQEVAATTHAPFRVLAAELWSRRAFLAPLFVGQVAVVMADNAALVWAAPVLSRHYGLQPGDFAGWMGTLVFGSGLIGTLLGGFTADWGQKSHIRGGLLLGAVVAATVGVPAALFPIAPSVTWFAVAFGTLSLCGAITGLVTSVALTVLIPNELRGLCIGAFIAFAGLIGFGIAPSLVTAISSLLGGEGHLGPALAMVGVVTGTLSVGGFLLAMRRAPLSAIDEPI
ncbi:MFS transporter [Sphingomonas rubra]|uniref:Major Facilitator Superfamily protein n=1 Tax=Sphingomonas rubra TaxID=634430 RepID=A0A1I5QM48_9SPHN|nr:MFS transporter [Sphingomonas rubra]SFP47333.1 Major Facilitator Superfamily protein [Sphingomonas rubra]